MTTTNTTHLKTVVDCSTAELERHLQDYKYYGIIEDAIRDSYNASLLEDVRKSLWGVNNGSELRDLAEIHRQKAERISASFTDEFTVLDLGTFTSTSVETDEWKTVFESCSLSDCLDYAVFAQANEEILRSEIYRIFKGFAFYTSGDESHLIDAFDLNDMGASYLSKEKQAEKIGSTLEKLNPVFGSLLCGYIEKVTTNATASSNSYGSAKNDGRWLNLLSDNMAGGISTVAHEIGHAIHYAIGINCRSSIDNRDATDEFQKDFSVEVTPKTPFDSYRDEIQYLWELYADGNIPEVREYQQKNFNEFFACAFEYWAMDETPTEYTAFFNKNLT